MTAVLAQVHEVIRAANDDLDIDPALAACVQLALAGHTSRPAPMRARYIGQVSHALNHAGQVERAEGLHRALPDAPTTHPFARSRRANGLAYGCWRRGELEGAVVWARSAARHAGDAGHVRLRAMALFSSGRWPRAPCRVSEVSEKSRRRRDVFKSESRIAFSF